MNNQGMCKITKHEFGILRELTEEFLVFQDKKNIEKAKEFRKKTKDQLFFIARETEIPFFFLNTIFDRNKFEEHIYNAFSDSEKKNLKMYEVKDHSPVFGNEILILKLEFFEGGETKHILYKLIYNDKTIRPDLRNQRDTNCSVELVNRISPSIQGYLQELETKFYQTWGIRPWE